MIKFNIDLSPLTHLVKINLFKIYIYIFVRVHTNKQKICLILP